MKTTRKFLQMVDLRVRQHRIGQVPTNSYQLGRLHSVESLAADHAEFAIFTLAGKTPESSLS